MIKDKMIILYTMLLIMSVIAFILIYVFDANGILGYLITLITFYLFIGSIIKLCRLSEKFKNSLFAIIDILFWLP